MKRRFSSAGLVVLLAAGVAGCASLDHLYRALYGGLQAREDIVNPTPPRSPAKDRPLTYDEYEAERQRKEPR